MLLHQNNDDFEELIQLTSEHVGIPENAVKRDYFITLILKSLSESEYVSEVVFKGGTSLSKCYPGSIERFSEDIDLTYVPEEDLSDKQINRRLKKIEECLIKEAKFEIVEGERNNRNKSSYVWFRDEFKDTEKIKLEIGSSVRPHPYSKKKLRSYIHDYLIYLGNEEAIKDFQLVDIEVNVLEIKRTFIDKIFSVKRHAICGTLPLKVRHIYDTVKLFQMPEIQKFLEDSEELKQIVQLTKETDSFYLQKRYIPENYNPLEEYDFLSWKDRFDEQIKNRYESIHKDLLYTNKKQEFWIALKVFEEINDVLRKIDE